MLKCPFCGELLSSKSVGQQTWVCLLDVPFFCSKCGQHVIAQMVLVPLDDVVPEPGYVERDDA